MLIQSIAMKATNYRDWVQLIITEMQRLPIYTPIYAIYGRTNIIGHKDYLINIKYEACRVLQIYVSL